MDKLGYAGALVIGAVLTHFAQPPAQIPQPVPAQDTKKDDTAAIVDATFIKVLIEENDRLSKELDALRKPRPVQPTQPQGKTGATSKDQSS